MHAHDRNCRNGAGVIVRDEIGVGRLTRNPAQTQGLPMIRADESAWKLMRTPPVWLTVSCTHCVSAGRTEPKEGRPLGREGRNPEAEVIAASAASHRSNEVASGLNRAKRCLVGKLRRTLDNLVDRQRPSAGKTLDQRTQAAGQIKARDCTAIAE